MNKSLLYLSAFVVGTISLLFADDHRDREKERAREEPQREVRERQERMHRESKEIHEAVRVGKISHEEGRENSRLLTKSITNMKKRGFGKK